MQHHLTVRAPALARSVPAPVTEAESLAIRFRQRAGHGIAPSPLMASQVL